MKKSGKRLLGLLLCFVLALSLLPVCVGAAEKTYSVKLKVNGGSYSGKTTLTHTAAQTLTLPDNTNIKKTNYLLSGWYEKSDFTGARYDVVPKNTAKNLTLYARWVKVVGKISNADQLNALAKAVNGGDNKKKSAYL
ncbi:MAG: InlB B-repeat-containing protein, partial [Oscillospiraceae bacterium]|nr:InlB B-repeat-containing protein [Oscillospiraceae bacterium]